MITRRLFATCCFILFLTPTLGWSLNESGDTPAAQSAPVPSITAKPVPAPPVPAKPVPAKPVPAKPVPAKPVPAKPIPAKPIPAKPIPAKPIPAKPVPAVTAPVKPPSLQSAPLQSAPLQSTPLQSATTPESFTDTTGQTIDIEVFVRDGCPQCDKAKEFLAKLQNLQTQLKIVIRDVRKEPAALELLKRMAMNHGNVMLDYPAFVVGGELIIGFSEEESTAQHILDTLAISHPTNQQDSLDDEKCTTGKELSCGLIPPAPVAEPENVVFNLFGYSVPLLQIGLPLFTLVMGMLDGFNHGSTWVLVLMISLLAPMKNRPFMLAVGGTFIVVQGIVYYMLMAAWLNLFMQIEISRISQIAVASIALIAGAIYFKNYIHFGRSLALSSQEISKPGIYTRIRKIVESRNLAGVLLATIVLAILVQISEFAYKSIFPALYTQVLTQQQLDSMSNYGYLLMYDLAYLLEDIIVLIIGVITLSESRPQDKERRMLKLISSLTLAGLGIYLLRAQY